MGFLSRQALIALDRPSSCSKLLAQLVQLQLWQNSPFAKQSQYLAKKKKKITMLEVLTAHTETSLKHGDTALAIT